MEKQRINLFFKNKIIIKLLEDLIMRRTIKYYEMRIHLLEQRDPNVNSKIINKLKRKVRAMKNTGQE